LPSCPLYLLTSLAEAEWKRCATPPPLPPVSNTWCLLNPFIVHTRLGHYDSLGLRIVRCLFFSSPIFPPLCQFMQLMGMRPVASYLLFYARYKPVFYILVPLLSISLRIEAGTRALSRGPLMILSSFFLRFFFSSSHVPPCSPCESKAGCVLTSPS